jgi:predicted metalloendopeptidase
MLLATLAAGALAAAPGPSIDLVGMDQTVQPGDDFFSYANGGWIKANPIPEDRAAWGVDAVLADQARKHTVELIQGAASRAATDPAARRIADFYRAYTDEVGIEAKGTKPIEAELTAIAAIQDKRDLAAALGRTLRADVDALNSTNFYTTHLFGLWVAQGLDDPSKNLPYLLQGGLLMPDREYYLKDDAKSAEVRAAYRAYVERLFELVGASDPKARAARVVELETKIAKVSATRVQSADIREPRAWKRSELATKAPGLDWTQFLTAAQLDKQKRFFAWHPSAIAGIAKLVATEPLEHWKDLLTAHLVNESAPFLPKAFVEARFDFFGKTLVGTPKLAERWKRGTDLTSTVLGDDVGKLYVEQYFSAEAKAKVKEMVADIVAAFGKRIDRLSWMSPATKVHAKEKLKTLIVGVGYPDRWKDYADLTVDPTDALGNVVRSGAFEYRRALAKLGRPVDRDEWWMTPQTVNAVNLPLQNALNFPAAILQPPYFDLKGDPAANYGAIGSVIGHEISHSFDDSGAQFDARGRMFNWWRPADAKHFEEAGAALAAQFDAYEALPGLHVNGRQTLSENIADVAGLAAAYDAWKSRYGSAKGAAESAAAPMAPAAAASVGATAAATAVTFTGEQVFFIAFAQAWRETMRDSLLRMVVITDGHAPAHFRADTVRNLDAWYEAFGIKATDRLALTPEKRVRVW